jgi:UDPglucose 6-dehydrogenase
LDLYEALKGAYATVVTEWEEVRILNLKRVVSLMKQPPVLVDSRNAFDPSRVRPAGIRYRSFGHAYSGLPKG